MNNPLFTDKKDKNLETMSQSRPVSKSTTSQPTNDNPALDFIRQKISSLYSAEPKAQTVMQESEVVRPRSKHQQYMYDLSQSGKSIVEIQTAWHNYYFSLPDEEKHQVWREFYESHAQLQTEHARKLDSQPGLPASMTPVQTVPKADVSRSIAGRIERLRFGLPINSDSRTVEIVKKQIIQRLTNRPKVSVKQNFKSLVFGLSLGALVIFILLFSFFNQIIITPFIQPSRNITALPLIINASTAGSYTSPEVIIPKINVEIPVDYTLSTDNESVIESALENGVIHYPSTELPGQDGNAAFLDIPVIIYSIRVSINLPSCYSMNLSTVIRFILHIAGRFTFIKLSVIRSYHQMMWRFWAACRDKPLPLRLLLAIHQVQVLTV